MNQLKDCLFRWWKTTLLSLVLFVSLFMRDLAYIPWIILIVGKAHSLGAWMSMWRADKLNWKFFSYICIVTATVSFWAIKLTSLWTLSLIAYSLFAVHFLYDEFNLTKDSKPRTSYGLISIGLLIPVFLTSFFKLNLPATIPFGIFIVGTIMEIFTKKGQDQTYINSKLIQIFILIASTMNYGVYFIMNTFLIFHYLFWFIYPVQKLHLNNPKERDGLIMMLALIMLSSVFIYSVRIWGIPEPYEVGLRIFFIATISHILTTAPFAYYFGLSKSNLAKTA